MKNAHQIFIMLLAVLFFAGGCRKSVDSRSLSGGDFRELLEKSKNYASTYPYHTDSALMILRELLPAQQGDDKAVNRGWVLNITGVAYDVKGVYDSAAYYFYEARRVAEETGNDSLQLSVYCNLGILQFALKNAGEAVEFYQKALPVAEKLNHAIGVANLMNNIGNTYMTLSHDYEKAIPWLERCLEASMAAGYDAGCRTAGFNLAEIYLETGETDKAENEIRRIMEQYGYDRYGGYLLGQIYFKKMAYRQALQTFHGLLTAPMNTREFELEIFKAIAETHKASGHLDSTVVYLEKSYALRDSLHGERSIQTIEKLKIQYDTEKKEHEIARQRNIIDRQNMQHGVLAGSVAVCALILVLLWYVLRLRTRRNLALTERNGTLAEMNATKDKFFSIIAHDLKNPAVAQRDALRTLVRNASLWDTHTLTGYCNELLKSAEGQVVLILDLLGWSRLQTGRMTCMPRPFYLAARLRADIALIRNTAVKKGVTFIDRIPDDAHVTADSNMISTIVRNLLANAVKFTPSGGTVTLSAEPAADGKCTVTVSDTGAGMSREQLHHLFSIDRPHFNEETADEQGTGLGLIVCREMLEKHGSTLHVESEEGKGSRFRFIF
jgi:signal transduction histidine kinase